MATEETIIISGYKQKIRYYGMITLRAWVIGASLLINGVLVAVIVAKLLGKLFS